MRLERGHPHHVRATPMYLENCYASAEHPGTAASTSSSRNLCSTPSSAGAYPASPYAIQRRLGIHGHGHGPSYDSAITIKITIVMARAVMPKLMKTTLPMFSLMQSPSFEIRCCCEQLTKTVQRSPRRVQSTRVSHRAKPVSIKGEARTLFVVTVYGTRAHAPSKSVSVRP